MKRDGIENISSEIAKPQFTDATIAEVKKVNRAIIVVVRQVEA